MPPTAHEIYLLKARKLLVRSGGRPARTDLVATFNRNIGALGFTLSPDLAVALSEAGEEEIATLYHEIVPVLRRMVGAHRPFKPMYPNFPKQVMEAAELELYLNAVTHYWGSVVSDVLKVPARFLPEYEAEPRPALPDGEVALRVIGLGDAADFGRIFTRLAGANASLPEADKEVVRYVQMVLNSFTRQPYCDLPECFAGWMARSEPQSGEVFEARTVRDRVDVASDTTVCIPVVVDLAERQVVWADVALTSRGMINNVRRNSDNLARIGKAVCGLVKPTLYDLFAMHAEARGTLAGREGADTVFSVYEGVTPFDQDLIASEFMGDGKEGPVVVQA